MSKWKIQHQPCPDQENCGSSDAYCVDDQGVGYCFSCTKTFRGDSGEPFEITQEEASRIDSLKVGGSFQALPDRSLKKETCEFFGVKIIDGNYVFPYKTPSGELVAQKLRKVNEKRFSWVGSPKESGLFGQDKFSAGQTITIVGGEFDAMAFRELSGDYPVVSVKNGENSVKDIRKALSDGYFKNFNKVYICLDNDSTGQEWAPKIAELFPIGKVKIVNLRHYNDPNDYLKNNAQKLFQACWWNAVEYTPAGIVAANEGGFESLFEDIDNLQLYPYPFDGLNEKVFGIRKGEMVTLVSGSGVGKCWRRDTPILMWDGSVKPVQLVRIGDKVMGPDSKPRNVTSTHVLEDYGYTIKPTKGSDVMVCSSEHILCLWDTKSKNYEEVSAKDFQKLPKSKRERLKLYRRGVDCFFENHHIPLIDPYFIGLWLGDGSHDSAYITTNDTPIKEYVKQLAKSKGCLYVEGSSGPYSCGIKSLSRDRFNPVIEILKYYGIYRNKEIPQKLLTHSRETRLKILAGLIDSDGYVSNNVVEIVQKRENLTEQIKFLARSLGFCVTQRSKFVNEVEYYRLFISGSGLEEIPVLLERKRCSARRQVKDSRVTGFTLENNRHKMVFYGFELDGDRKHLMGDFTVAHNSAGIGETAYKLHMENREKIGMLMLEENTKKTKLRMMSYYLNKPLHLTLLGRLKGKFDFLDKVLDKLFENGKVWEWTPETKRALQRAWDAVIERKAEDGEQQLWLFDHFGSNQIDTIVNRIDAMVTGLGCQFIFLDHISMVVSDQQNADERKALDELATKLRTLVERRNFALIIVSHLRRPGGKPHEEGGETSLADIRGTAGIGQLSDVVIGFERNQQHPDEYLRNVTKMRVLKNRFAGMTGIAAAAHYDINTGRLEELSLEELKEHEEGAREFEDETVFDKTPFGTLEEERNNGTR